MSLHLPLVAILVSSTNGLRNYIRGKYNHKYSYMNVATLYQASGDAPIIRSCSYWVLVTSSGFIIAISIIPGHLSTTLIFCSYCKHSWFYFHKFDKITFGSSYKPLKLREIHDFIFMNVSKLCEIQNFVLWIKKQLARYGITFEFSRSNIW